MQIGRIAEAEHELERLWGPSHVKQAMADLIRNEQTQDNGTTSWMALADPRYIKGTYGAVLSAFLKPYLGLGFLVLHEGLDLLSTSHVHLC